MKNKQNGPLPWKSVGLISGPANSGMSFEFKELIKELIKKRMK